MLIVAAAKRYQHNGYRIAAQQGELRLGAGSVYWLCLKGAGIGLAAVVIAGMLAAMAVVGASALSGSKVVLMISTFVSFGLTYLLLFALVGPFFTARFKNLLWNRTTPSTTCPSPASCASARWPGSR